MDAKLEGQKVDLKRSRSIFHNLNLLQLASVRLGDQWVLDALFILSLVFAFDFCIFSCGSFSVFLTLLLCWWLILLILDYHVEKNILAESILYCKFNWESFV